MEPRSPAPGPAPPLHQEKQEPPGFPKRSSLRLAALHPSISVIHPTEIFDTDSLRLMSQALEAAVNTMRLGGVEPDNSLRLSMAQRLMAAGAAGECTFLSLTTAALGWQPAEPAS
jgi:hypothetical protein